MEYLYFDRHDSKITLQLEMVLLEILNLWNESNIINTFLKKSNIFFYKILLYNKSKIKY